MTTLRAVAQIPAKPGSEGIVRDALTTLAAADGHLAGAIAVHPLQVVVLG
jgi:hypothetical protein